MEITAGAVGTVLVAINQTGPLVRGQFGPLFAARLLLDHLIPLVVSNLGLLAGSRRG